MEKYNLLESFKLFVGFGFIVFIILLMISLCWGHDKDVVHPGLTVKGLTTLNSSFYSPDYRNLVRQGSIDEDKAPRWLAHGYSPVTGSGWFWGSGNARVAAQDRWQNAIDEYNNGNFEGEDGSFHWLGRTIHLLEDMTSPAHVHTDIHIPIIAEEDFERWGAKNFDPTDDIFSSLTPFVPADYSIEGFIHTLAVFTYNASAFQGELLEVEGAQPSSELRQMFPSLHYYDGGILGDNYWEIDNIGTFEKVSVDRDDWWPCEGHTDDHSGPGGVRRIVGNFYIENSGGDDDNLIPAVYKGSPNTETLLRIYGDILYPECVKYCAGLLQVFPPNPTITQSNFPLLQSQTHYVGDTITAKFTITNKGSASITFKVLTVRGRGPGGDTDVQDFTPPMTDVTLGDNQPCYYQGSLKLTKTGKYHFFCAYQTPPPDDKWYTDIPTESGLTNVLDIEVFPQSTSALVDLFFNQTTFTPGNTRKATVTVQGKGYIVDTYLQVTSPDGATRYAYYEGGFTDPNKPLSFTSQKRSLTGVQWEVKDTTWTFNSYTFTGTETEGSYTWNFWYEDVKNPGKPLAADKETYSFHKTAPPPDDSGFIADITIPDGSTIPANQSFTKTWRIKNTGKTTWNSSYKWQFDGGDKMSAPDYISIPHQVNPGQTVDLSVPMAAPKDGGIYTGYWKMKNPQGQLFGVRAYVKIQVPEIREGDLVKGKSENTVYLIKNGQKWPFLNQDFFLKMGYDFSKVKVVDRAALDIFPLGKPIIGNNNRVVIKKPPEDTVWLILAGKKRPFVSWDIFLASGFKNEEILIVTQAILDMFPNGAVIHSTDDILNPEVPPGSEDQICPEEDKPCLKLKIHQEDTHAYFFAVDDGTIRLDMYKEDLAPDSPNDHIHQIIVTDLLTGDNILNDRMDDSESKKSFDIQVHHRGTYQISCKASLNCVYWFEITPHKLVLDISKGLTLYDKGLGSNSTTNLYFYAPKGTFSFTFKANNRDNFWCRVYDSADHEIKSIEIYTMDQPITGTLNVPDSEAGRMYKLKIDVQDVTITSDKVKYMSMGGQDNPQQIGKRSLFDPEWKREELWFRSDYMMYFKPTADSLSLEVVVDDFNNTNGCDDLSIFVYNDQDQEIFHGTAWDPEDGNDSNMRYLGYYPFDITHLMTNKVYRVKFYNEGNETEINYDFSTDAKHIIPGRIILNERLASGNLYFYAPPDDFTLEAVTIHGMPASRQTLRVYDSHNQEVGYLTIDKEDVPYFQKIPVPKEEVGKIWRLEVPSEDFTLTYTNIAYFSTAPDKLFDFVKPETEAVLEGEADGEYHFASAVTLKFLAEDYISGVQKTFYRLNGEGWLEYNADTPPVVNDSGNYKLEYYSIDKEGNQEDVKSLSFSAEIDKTAPTVLNFYPQRNAVDILAWSNIEIAFSEPMEKTSTESAFSIQPVLDGVFSWNGNTLVFDPDSPLLPCSIYELAIRNSAKDLHGNPLSQEITWSFTTEALLGDVSGNGKVTSYDAALILKYTVGKIIIPSPEFPCFTMKSADVSGTGGITNYDAVLVLQYATGMIDAFPKELGLSVAPELQFVSGNIQLSDLKVKAGEKFTVPITLSSAKNVFGAELTITFDANVFTLTKISPSDSTFAENLFEYKIDKGQVRIALIEQEAMPEKTTLCHLEFQTTGQSIKPISPLKLTKLRLNETNIPVDANAHTAEIELLPTKFALLQNFPNPFNPDTWIPYALVEASPVVIQIYNLKGHLVKSIPLGFKQEGFYTTRERAAYWNGRNDAGEAVASGVYFYQIQAGDSRAMRKMVIVK